MKYRMIKKRRRAAVTDYRKRIALLLGGMPRVVIRKSNRNITMQIVGFQPEGDRVLAGINSNELRKYEWQSRSNTPTAYLTGLALAQKAKKLNLGEAVVDIGIYKPGKASVIFAAAKGAIDGGLKIRNKIEFDEKRLRGTHISEYAKLIKADNQRYSKQFSGYQEGRFDVENIGALFENAKKRIMAGA